MGLLLLVGNSRWHWGQRHVDGLVCWHEPAESAAARLLAEPVGCLDDLEAWACVGDLPPGLAFPEGCRIGLPHILCAACHPGWASTAHWWAGEPGAMGQAPCWWRMRAPV